MVKKCKHCGEAFDLPRTNQKHTHIPKDFCSYSCRNKSRIDPSKKSTFTCDWCQKEFVEWTYRQPRFCSRQCRSEFAARQPRPSTIKPEIHLTLECQNCGRDYQTTTHQKRLRGSRFCSSDCQYATASIERRGENNPNWTGGTADPAAYGPNWRRQKRRAKKRDNHSCQVCSYKSGGNRCLDVHHIIPIKHFSDNWQSANELTNLISLCRFCHTKVEKGKIPCPLLPQ